MWAFVVYYGFTFAIAKENSDTDIIRYIDDLHELYGKSLNFGQMIDLFKESGEVDILRTIIAIVVSRFTESVQVLTAVYGFIFGFFFSRNLWYIADNIRGKIRGVNLMLIATFFLVDPFWNLNGFRFNTAILIFLYGILPYLFEGKKSKLIWCFLSVLVHFSFLFPVAITVFYILVGNRKTVFFVFFIISIFVSNINVAEFNTFLEANVPEVFVERSKNYRDEDRVDEFRQTEEGTFETEQGTKVVKNWYAIYYIKALYFSIMGILVGLYIFGTRVFAANERLLSGYCFNLLLFGFGNFMISLPSGERFLMIAAMSSLALIIFYLQSQSYEKNVNKLTLIASPAILLYIIVSFRGGLYSISVNTVIGNPVLVLFTDYNLSLNDLIK